MRTQLILQTNIIVVQSSIDVTHVAHLTRPTSISIRRKDYGQKLRFDDIEDDPSERFCGSMNVCRLQGKKWNSVSQLNERVETELDTNEVA